MNKIGQGWPLFFAHRCYMNLKLRLLLIGLCYFFSVGHFTHAAVFLDRSGRFIDEQGQRLLFRGINVGADSKVPPYRPIDGQHDLELLSKLGMNVIRLIFHNSLSRGIYKVLHRETSKGTSQVNCFLFQILIT